MSLEDRLVWFVALIAFLISMAVLEWATDYFLIVLPIVFAIHVGFVIFRTLRLINQERGP